MSYEEDREDNAVNEGKYMDDEGDLTLYTADDDETAEFDLPIQLREPTVDEAFAEPDQMQRALMAYRIIQLDAIRQAARETTTQNSFLMQAFRRNGVL